MNCAEQIPCFCINTAVPLGMVSSIEPEPFNFAVPVAPNETATRSRFLRSGILINQTTPTMRAMSLCQDIAFSSEHSTFTCLDGHCSRAVADLLRADLHSLYIASTVGCHCRLVANQAAVLGCLGQVALAKWSLTYRLCCSGGHFLTKPREKPDILYDGSSLPAMSRPSLETQKAKIVRSWLLRRIWLNAD